MRFSIPKDEVYVPAHLCPSEDPSSARALGDADRVCSGDELVDIHAKVKPFEANARSRGRQKFQRAAALALWGYAHFAGLACTQKWQETRRIAGEEHHFARSRRE